MCTKAALIITPSLSHIFHLNNDTNAKNFFFFCIYLHDFLLAGNIWLINKWFKEFIVMKFSFLINYEYNSIDR